MLYQYQEYKAKPTTKAASPIEASNSCKTGITEIVLPNAESLALVLPSLAFLSRSQNSGSKNDRWLTWFPPKGITKSMLSGYGFDLSRVRFIYPKDEEHCYWLLCEALVEGNSHTVVANPGILSEEQVARLERSSIAGQCSGLLLRSRVH